MKRYILNHPSQRSAASYAIMQAPEGWVCEIKEETRSNADNAALHAMLTDISKQVKWYGQSLPVEVWKRLCTASWLREIGGNPLLVPALDGAGVDIIYEKTSQMSHKQIVSLMAWVEAFGTEQGVKFSTNRDAPP